MSIAPQHQPDPELTIRFQALAREWKQSTAHLSSPTAAAAHPACQQILDLGPAIIPLILEYTVEHGGHWEQILMTLSGENPMRPEESGNVPKNRQRWLEWADRTAIFNELPVS